MASVLIGLGGNQLRETPLPLLYETKQARLEREVQRIGAGQRAVGGAEAPASGPQVLTLEEFEAIRAGALILDARPEIFYRIGHVPGALSLPRKDFETAYAALGARLAEGRPLVVYCAGETCEDAELVRTALARLGHAQVQVFQGGWEEWQAAGRAEEKAP
ncbi:MAG: Rhodanese domain protein [Rariglobus sp.]|jgi:3-mercaptopyruvate sulfurtransferase SseA|nr:Rhodanese domain protein [Rariglobus sp.]